MTGQVKIPNNYKRWQTTEETPPEILPPEVLDDPDTRVKLIFRGGEQSNSAVLGRQYFWGYTSGSPFDIIAYRVIKLEKGGWIDWGRKYAQDEYNAYLDHLTGVPQGLNPTARVQVWLRDFSRPQDEIRVAVNWYWLIDGRVGNDIMRYRVV